MRTLLSSVVAALFLAFGAVAADKNTEPVFQNPRLASLMQSLEDRADRFEDRFQSALHSSSINGTDLEDALHQWTEDLEDEIDDMAEDFREKDSAEFNNHVENVLMVASAINRGMLRREFSSVAQAEWATLRKDLNDVAMLLERAVLPNLTMVTFAPATVEILSRGDVRQIMDELEASTDRFEEKFKNAWFTNIAPKDQAELFKRWVEALEDTSDQMLSEYRAKDPADTQRKLELTLLIAEGINRMVLDSTTSSTPVTEWNRVRQHLNTLAQAFNYAVLPDTKVTVQKLGSL